MNSNFAEAGHESAHLTAAPPEGSTDLYSAKTACRPSPPPSGARIKSGNGVASVNVNDDMFADELFLETEPLPLPIRLPQAQLDSEDELEAFLDANIALEPAPPSQPLELTPVHAVLRSLLSPSSRG